MNPVRPLLPLRPGRGPATGVPGRVAAGLARGVAAALCSALLFPLALWGLNPEQPITHYIHEVWRHAEGLPQTGILSILQTREGYLWMGTQDGLIRFDGVRFQVFDKHTTPSLKNNWVSALYENRDGDLWIGTSDGRLTRYRRGVFTAERFVGGSLVNAIAQDAHGALWIGTSAGGVFRMEGATLSSYTTKEGLSHDAVLSLIAARDGSVWIGTRGGLDHLQDGRITSYGRGQGVADEEVYSLYEDAEGAIWVGTGDGGLYSIAPGTSPSRLAPAPQGRGLPASDICALATDRDGNLWIGTYSAGLFRVSRSGSLARYTAPDGLLTDSVLGLYEDREGSLWVGTNGSGLQRLRDSFLSTLTTRDGLAHDDVASVCGDGEGALWFGTERGLTRLKDGVARTFTKSDGLGSDSAWTMAPRSGGGLWIWTSGALNLYRDGHITTHTAEAGITKGSVTALHSDPQGNLWIGGDDGLLRWSGRSVTRYGAAQGLTARHFLAVTSDGRGDVWVGTATGLFQMHEGTFTPYTTRDGLPSDFVLSLYADHEGTLWVGTTNGLSSVRERRVRSFAGISGLDDNVTAVLEDDAGFLWLGSTRGITRVRKAELASFTAGNEAAVHAVVFGEPDGMRSPECNGGSQPSGWKSADGRLWFPTAKGVAVADPRRLRKNGVPPPVVLEQSVAEGHGFPGTGETRLAAGTERIEFHYAGLSLLIPSRVKFRYRLEGFDKEWMNAGSRRVAYYTHLPPGSYAFQVMASNNDGVWSREAAVRRFSIAPHFYQTAWFYLLCAGTLMAAAWALHRHRVAHLVALERIRTRIATDLHDDIGSTLSQIAILSEVAQQRLGPARPELTEPLSTMARSAREAIDAMSDIVWAITPNRDRLADLSQRMRRFAGDLLTSRNIVFEFQTSGLNGDRKLSPQLRRALFLIFKEAVTNSVRHAQASRVRISLAIDGPALRLRVEDDGTGFDPLPESEGNGLMSMRRRAEGLGGRLDVDSRGGEGTTLALQVPLGRRAAGLWERGHSDSRL